MASTYLIAAAGWSFAYFNSKSAEERKARIERVNEQLRCFYGPLLACVSATKAAFLAMVRQHHAPGGRPDAAAFHAAVVSEPEGQQAKAYRMWVQKVLQPINEKAADIIAAHIDLLDAQQVVPELLQLIAHVSAMRVCIHRWSEGDLTARSVITYPDTLQGYVLQEFARIKLLQSKLLGFKPPPAPAPAPGQKKRRGQQGEQQQQLEEEQQEELVPLHLQSKL